MTTSLVRRLWILSVTGLPYALYKFGGGLAASTDLHPVLGSMIMGWGVLDLGLNLGWALAPARISPCAASAVGRMLDRSGQRDLETLGLAVDTLLAFAIVSTMIWFGRSASLPPPLPMVWKVAVIASILGAGIERVWGWLRQRQGAPAGPLA
ncbi:MAG: hypothetical protein ABIJ09_26085 [Pseudomonadota bacterium]